MEEGRVQAFPKPEARSRKAIARLKYDAVQSSPRRRTVYVSSLSEDRELKPAERQRLSSESRDLMRNFSLAGFAIRKHVQYIADFRFQCQTDNKEFNRLVESKIRNWKKRRNCDGARRHCFDVLIQLMEILRVIDGDVGVLKIDSGLGRIQLVEGDRIRSPVEFGGDWSGEDQWIHGVKLGRFGQDVKYAIHKRLDWGGFELEREVWSDHLLLCGYYTRADQIRGVSPLAPVITQFQHLYEGIEYALAKAKMSQLLGLVTTKVDDTSMMSERRFDVDEDDEDETASPGLPPTDDDDEVRTEIREKWGKGIAHLNLDEGEDAKILESSTPSTQFQEFVVQVTRMCLAALDIPYSFYNGERTNFYGSRGDLNNYIGSCQKRQIALKETLEEITDWLLRLWVMDGYLELPDGMTVDDIEYEWRGAGIPYWRLIDDSKGLQIAIQNGFTNPQQVCMEHGTDYYENIDEIEIARRYARGDAQNPRAIPVDVAFATPIETNNIGL